MAELAYIKLWAEFEKYFGVLGAVEVGRLILGAQEYAFHGAEPQFTGNERILWPVLKESIDKDKAYNEKQQSNGSKGGRPKKPNETQQNPEKPNETQNNPTKPHIVNRKQKTENITTTTTAREELETENLKCCVSCYEQNIGAINRAVFDEIRAQLQVVEPDLMRKDGKIGKWYKRGNDGSMNVSLASCENYKTCDARWEEEEFFVEPDGTFYDYKYSEDE